MAQEPAARKVERLVENLRTYIMVHQGLTANDRLSDLEQLADLARGTVTGKGEPLPFTTEVAHPGGWRDQSGG